MNMGEAADWLAANILSTLPHDEEAASLLSRMMAGVMTDFRNEQQEVTDSAEKLISNLRVMLIRTERDLKAAEDALPEGLRGLDAVPTIELPLDQVRVMMRRSIHRTTQSTGGSGGKKPRAARSKGAKDKTRV
jgi:hypothetical protein